MENNLFPEIIEEEEIDETSEQDIDTPVGYKNGVMWDYELGDFARDGKNKLLDSDGIESWRSWCTNCIRTERYSHLAYSTDFGVEWDTVFSAETREEAESILTRQITEALLADPYQRTNYIEEIECNWSGSDAVELKIIVHGVEDVTIDITAYITQGGV